MDEKLLRIAISLRIILQRNSKLLFYIESRLDKAQSAFEAIINLREFVENAIHIATESSVITPNVKCTVQICTILRRASEKP